ncbi:small ribosomal subunit biogenesis GTPase RsgA [Psychromonas sp. Urea-02u-13]|uniref:small ribosomal subunit biogenesis GTPase RsgA n=1 Tax=Psychromonas sp. Urea-02u-13 TaxID=2058326 RepID=UPI000C325A63|nr:small ribosomal subunit biogenesis GTPase RsgA [Psychromonas sp. Urea-02u-13]PKG39673.1 ribosome biogenesis GTPase RsgA [Psychromonas sp. Urea-02u-13]
MTKKKKLSQNQVRRVQSNQNKRLNKKESKEWDETELGPQLQGVVISRFGQHADIEDENGNIERCNLRRAIKSLVTGDKVVWRAGNESYHGISGVVEAVHPRTTVLTRPDYYDGIKPIAANIDHIIIVSSIAPDFSRNIIDRYLVACEDIGITPIIVLNKSDLLDDASREHIDNELQSYRDIGYNVLYSSMHGDGLDNLKAVMKDKINIFVGQSGVGKTSLLNMLLPEVEAVTGEISEGSGLGKHTTTTARLYHFPEGGDLIDSPGIREFSLWHLAAERIASGFIEFRDYLGECRFRDCKHKADPGCALVAAVEEKKIDDARYRSFLRILETMDDAKNARHRDPNTY